MRTPVKGYANVYPMHVIKGVVGGSTSITYPADRVRYSTPNNKFKRRMFNHILRGQYG